MCSIYPISINYSFCDILPHSKLGVSSCEAQNDNIHSLHGNLFRLARFLYVGFYCSYVLNTHYFSQNFMSYSLFNLAVIHCCLNFFFDNVFILEEK